MAGRLVTVHIAHDDEADVWYVERSDVAGLRAEAETADALIQRIPPCSRTWWKRTALRA